MSIPRIVGWSLLACLAGAVAFLAATVRVVEPQPEAAPSLAVEEVAVPALLVPVAGIGVAQLRSNWGEARGGV